MTPSAESLRLQFRRIVAAKGFVADEMWRKPCRGYNIQFVLPLEVSKQIGELQQRLASLEPGSLLVCPPRTLHISVASILAVRSDYGRSKDDIWAGIRKDCCVALANVAKDTAPFVIDFRDLVVTDTAVILIGTDDGSMARLRRCIYAALPVPEPTHVLETIHITVLRYARCPEVPEVFIDAVEGLTFQASVMIDGLSIEKESVYPSIESETQFGAMLGRR